MTNLRFYNYGDDWVGMEAEPSDDREATLQPEQAESSRKDEKQAEQQLSEKAAEPPKYEPPSYQDDAEDPPVSLPAEKERPGPPPPPGSFPEEPPHGPPPHHHHHHHGPLGCGRGRGGQFHRGGPFGGRGGPGFGPHPFFGGPGRCGRGGPPPGGFPFRGWGGPRGRRWRDPAFWAQFRGGPGEEQSFNMDVIAKFLKESFGIDLGGGDRGRGRNDPDADYVPPVDVFDSPAAFVIHVSLAGAKKEDLGVTWNAEESSLHVAGVIHRPGDEALLKTIAMDERDVGAFERNVRLGDRTHPAAIDADNITARMEDGVLIVEVPKAQGFVKSKKVEVE